MLIFCRNFISLVLLEVKLYFCLPTHAYPAKLADGFQFWQNLMQISHFFQTQLNQVRFP